MKILKSKKCSEQTERDRGIEIFVDKVIEMESEKPKIYIKSVKTKGKKL